MYRKSFYINHTVLVNLKPNPENRIYEQSTLQEFSKREHALEALDYLNLREKDDNTFTLSDTPSYSWGKKSAQKFIDNSEFIRNKVMKIIVYSLTTFVILLLLYRNW